MSALQLTSRVYITAITCLHYSWHHASTLQRTSRVYIAADITCLTHSWYHVSNIQLTSRVYITAHITRLHYSSQHASTLQLTSRYQSSNNLNQNYPPIFTPYWTKLSHVTLCDGPPSVRGPPSLTTVTTKDFRSSLQGGRFMHSDRAREETCWTVQLHC